MISELVLSQFVEDYDEWLHDDLNVPFLIYPDEYRFIKTRFGFKPDRRFNYETLPKKIIKLAQKNTGVKLKAGDNFCIRKSSVKYELIPGFGIVASNIYARKWRLSDLSFLLDQDILGIYWHGADNTGWLIDKQAGVITEL